MQYTPVTRLKVVREGSLDGRPRITGTDVAIRIVQDFFAYRASDREEFCVLHLNTKHIPISVSVCSTGTLDASLVHPREVFKGAVVAGAAAILLMHNHPSGDPTPSPEDIRVTKALMDGGKLLGIQVLDHIVCGELDAVSLKEKSLV